MLDELGDREADEREQETLAKYSGWGGLGSIFDPKRQDWQAERESLRLLLGQEEYRLAREGVLSAHYTNPAFVAPMWNAVRGLGVDGGRVLEPGCGSGNFIGGAPEGFDMVGVEIDSTTARIASKLYPDAKILNESFGDTRPDGAWFDVSIGNVPFGNFQVRDDTYNPSHFPIHNHFIAKSVALTHPGGLVAVISSHWTLDAKNPAFRRYLYQSADLVGAVRLPTGAHDEAADTQALTDVLIFRRRAGGEEPQPFDWESSTAHFFGEHSVMMNTYFDRYPERVLGELSAQLGMNSTVNLTVTSPSLSEVGNELSRALETVVARAVERGLTFTRPTTTAPQASNLIDGRQLGHISQNEDGSFSIQTTNGLQVHKVAKKDRAEMASLLALRDQTVELVNADATSTVDTPELEAQRKALKESYLAHVDRFGPINERKYVSRRTRKKDEDGNPIITTTEQVRRVIAAFRKDPYAAVTLAIEDYDIEEKKASPADILTKRTIGVTPQILGADSLSDALALSLNQTGKVDVDRIAYLLDSDRDAVLADLLEQRLVFRTPGCPDELVAREEYLAGNVRAKLARANEASALDSAFEANVEALKQALPADIPLEDIQITPGAPWLGRGVHVEFYHSVICDLPYRNDDAVTFNPSNAHWSISKRRAWTGAFERWSVSNRGNADRIFEALLNHTDVTITAKDSDGTTYVDVTATAEAHSKLEEMREAFIEFCWSTPERVEDLTRRYNDTFNSFVQRSYERAGQALQLPGLNTDITPYSHQRSAVARIVSEPTVGLFHEVGAGKTLEMIMGAMELKRLGLASKPMIVVPNHMLLQFANEWQQAYPSARVMITDKEDLKTAGARREFLARVSTHDLDGVVITQSQFKHIGMKPSSVRAYMSAEIEEIEEALENATERNYSVSQLTQRLKTLQSDLEKEVNKVKDTGLFFEELGIDYLMVDEAHHFKNLGVVTSLSGMSSKDSGRARDLHMKIDYLRTINPDHYLTLATGTPIANSIAESHTMLRYLSPDLLRDAGIAKFDAFAGAFTQETRDMEITATGKLKARTRIARFQNLPEFMSIWGQVADVKMSEDLNLARPIVHVNSEGKHAPEIASIPAGAEMEAFSQTLSDRADKIHSGSVEPSEDNWLKLSNDGRQAAIDLRLVDYDPGSITKASTIAANVVRIYNETSDRVYVDKSGEQMSLPGGLQLIFSDRSTPKGNGEWNVYQEIKDNLVEMGIPSDEIAFIHEANTDEQKEDLFMRCREGQVRVIIGSTDKMGTGTNIQLRAVALHHVDAPWRPADITQREGRIIRAGNQNSQVSIFRYVAEKSYDAVMWQTLERKQKMISQVMRGKAGERVFDDEFTDEMGFAQTKAVATGNPHIIERTKVEADVARFKRDKASHRRMVMNQRAGLARDQTLLSNIDRALPLAEELVGKLRPTSGDAFAMVGRAGELIRDRKSAVAYLNAQLTTGLNTWVIEALRNGHQMHAFLRTPMSLTLGGITLECERALGKSPTQPACLEFTIQGVREKIFSVTIDLNAVLEGNNIGLITRLEHHVGSLPQKLSSLEEKRDQLTREIDKRQAFIATPFSKAKQLEDAETELARLTRLVDEYEANYQSQRSNTAQADLEHDLNNQLRFSDGHEGFYTGMSTWPVWSMEDAEAIITNSALAENLNVPPVSASYVGGDTWRVDVHAIIGPLPSTRVLALQTHQGHSIPTILDLKDLEERTSDLETVDAGLFNGAFFTRVNTPASDAAKADDAVQVIETTTTLTSSVASSDDRAPQTWRDTPIESSTLVPYGANGDSVVLATYEDGSKWTVLSTDQHQQVAFSSYSHAAKGARATGTGHFMYREPGHDEWNISANARIARFVLDAQTFSSDANYVSRREKALDTYSDDHIQFGALELTTPRLAPDAVGATPPEEANASNVRIGGEDLSKATPLKWANRGKSIYGAKNGIESVTFGGGLSFVLLTQEQHDSLPDELKTSEPAYMVASSWRAPSHVSAVARYWYKEYPLNAISSDTPIGGNGTAVLGYLNPRVFRKEHSYLRTLQRNQPRTSPSARILDITRGTGGKHAGSSGHVAAPPTSLRPQASDVSRGTFR